ncbi:hypothetical protein HK100_009226, partial [Physocladia obscura]
MAFGEAKIPTVRRIGPHNQDLLSVLIGNMLGDGSAQFRSGSPRFALHMSGGHMEYLYRLHAFYSQRGYCSYVVPTIKPQAPQANGKIYYSGKFYLFTFASLRWVYDMFYLKGVKRIPANIGEFLTPLGLAI